MAGAQGRFDGGALTQAGIFVALSTLALTASFLGLVALVTGTVTGSNARLPAYVLGTALAFVGAILLFEAAYRDGRRVLEAAAAVAVGTLVLLLFGGEGVAYLLQQPDRVASSLPGSSGLGWATGACTTGERWPGRGGCERRVGRPFRPEHS